MHDGQARLTITEHLFKTFDKVQTLIESKEEKDRMQDPNFIAECEQERAIFEQSYFTAVAAAHHIIEGSVQQAVQHEVVASKAAPK